MVKDIVWDRIRASLWGIFIADALSMPVHWYYDTNALKRDFGVIQYYCAPKDSHPTSIMNVANTGRGGRGSQDGDIVGGIILHDKKQFWGKKNVHYHQGMSAGDNTLNSLIARVLLRSINENKTYDKKKFLNDYCAFMTTPKTHNDTYAESYHRDFFSNYQKGTPLENCAGEEAHDTASIGGFVTLPIIIFDTILLPEPQAVTAGLNHLHLTHKSPSLDNYAVAYIKLLRRLVLCEKEFESESDKFESALLESNTKELGINIDRVKSIANNKNTSDADVVSSLGSACYITSSYPVCLFLGMRYNNFIDALLANTNSGGENCHRGSVLGSIMGARLGMSSIPPNYINGLTKSKEIENEINNFVKVLQARASSAI